jgi:hypothetical protein
MQPHFWYPVKGCGCSFDCEMSRFPHIIDSQVTGGGEVASHMRGQAAHCSRYSFLLEAESPPVPSAAESVR